MEKASHDAPTDGADESMRGRYGKRLSYIQTDSVAEVKDESGNRFVNQ